MKTKSKILVTGGAGYIGSHAVKLLHTRGYEVTVFDNLIYGHREFLKWGSFIEGDLSDQSLIDQVLQDGNFSGVMHFAAYTYVGESVSDPEKYYRNNVQSTLNLLSAMRKSDVKNLIYSSTCATYGLPTEIPIPENHSQKPINPYGKTKLIMEMAMEDYSLAYGLKYCPLRYFNAAGADPDGEIGEWHDPETHLIPLVLDAALGIRPSIKIFGTDYDTPDGSCIRDYIHVNDLADAHILALEYLLEGGKSTAFNLGNGHGYSVREVIDMAGKVTGKSINTEEADRRAGDPPALVGSDLRAREILGWNQKYADLESIIETAFRWHKNLQRLK